MEKQVNNLDVSALDEALALLHFGFRAVVLEPDRILEKKGLGRVHHRILFFVAKNPGIHVGDLLAVLDVSKQALHGPMRELQRQGLVEAEIPPENKRARALRLTRSGAALESRLSGIQRDLFAAAFVAAGPGAERGFRAVMRALGGDRGATLSGVEPRE